MKSNQRVLVVDDEPLMQDLLEETLKRQNFDVQVVDCGNAALESLKKKDYDLVITDVMLPDINGMEILQQAQHMTEEPPGVIMITAYATVKDAVRAIKNGAYDYITKPFDIDEIEVTLNKYFKYRKLERENRFLRQELKQQDIGLSSIVGKSEAMQQVFEKIRMVAETSSTVLISGECGTGKELVARAIHELSDRKENPFIALNCAAVPATLMESELFGHERGAYTGAHMAKQGKFKLADKGSILLDEISEMEANLQAKLLRVLQEREFETLGGTKTIKVDVRVMATTNRDLEEMVSDGSFREDLYYRLMVFPITLPPLRERKEDIPLLIDHFVEKFSITLNKQVEGVDDEVYELLNEYSWPGNVRELGNAMEHAVITMKNGVLRPENFALIAKRMKKNGAIKPSSLANIPLRELEKKAIFDTLKACKNNRSHAAKILGISVRTLRNKLKEYRENNELPEDFDDDSNQ